MTTNTPKLFHDHAAATVEVKTRLVPALALYEMTRTDRPNKVDAILHIADPLDNLRFAWPVTLIHNLSDNSIIVKTRWGGEMTVAYDDELSVIALVKA